MTCSRSAGIEEISRPPLRAMTSACCSGDRPAASLTSSDDVALCALAASGINHSSSEHRTARITVELTCSLLTRRIAWPLLQDLRIPAPSGPNPQRLMNRRLPESGEGLQGKRRADLDDSAVAPNAAEIQAIASPQRAQESADLKIF